MAVAPSKTWRKFPPLATQIDWSNPLTRNLGRVITPSNGYLDRANNTLAVPVGTIARNPLGFYGQASTSSSIELKDFSTTRYTCFFVAVAYTATGLEPRIISRSSPDPTYHQNYALNLNAGITPRAGHKQVSNNAYPYVQSSISVQAGSICVGASTYDGTNIKVFTNGQLGGSVAASDPYTSLGAGSGTQILNSDGTSRPPAGVYSGPGLLLAAIWNRALTDAEVAEVSENPWQLFRPQSQQLAVFSPVYQPGSDITVTGWTGSPDNVNLYANIDESTASDTDYVLSPSVSSSPGPAIFGLSPSSLAAGNYTVNLRARRTGSVGQVRALLVNSSGTTVGTSSWQTLTTTYTTYNLAITTTGTAARLRFEVQE